MGVARGAVRAAAVGAERDDEAWSSVGGHWRIVRIRYPRFVPPGYGRHPALVALLGLFQLALALAALPAATAAGDALLALAAGATADDRVPVGLDVGVSVALGIVVAAAALLALRGGSMALTGAADLLSPRRRFEGRVLRVRRRGDDERPRWYVAADDGTSSRIRAWRTAPGGVVQGATVRAEVTRWLAHVRNLEVVEAAPSRPPLPADEETADDRAPLEKLLGTAGPARHRHQRLRSPTGPPPPLPTASEVSAALGRAVDIDSGARPHPLARDGRAVTFAAGDGTTVQVAWVDPALLEAHRAMPRLLHRRVIGVGDEAYRAVIGGGVVTRHGNHVLVVMGRLPGASDDERNRALEEVARTAVSAGSGRTS
jgi:hypothetical protein